MKQLIRSCRVVFRYCLCFNSVLPCLPFYHLSSLLRHARWCLWMMWCQRVPNLRRSWNHSSFSPKRWLHVYKQAFDGKYYRHPENGPGRQMPPIMTPLKPRACCCETTLQKVWTLRWLGLSFECSISFFFCCLFWLVDDITASACCHF